MNSSNTGKNESIDQMKVEDDRYVYDSLAEMAHYHRQDKYNDEVEERRKRMLEMYRNNPELTQPQKPRQDPFKKPKPLDYSSYREPEDTKIPAIRNDYDYGTDISQNSAAKERIAMVSDLFPYQNAKSYESKGGREFLADFTSQTRGQLIACMAQVAQEQPKEFAKLWIEMEKFNTPQQAAVDVNANINAKGELYAKLQAMSSPNGQAEELLDTMDMDDSQYLEEGDLITDPEDTTPEDEFNEDDQSFNNIEDDYEQEQQPTEPDEGIQEPDL